MNTIKATVEDKEDKDLKFIVKKNRLWVRFYQIWIFFNEQQQKTLFQSMLL